jgi:CheY-like chemotaxis protein
LPTLILLDLKMPSKSDLDLLKWLKEQPGLKRLPVVVQISSIEKADINPAYDFGANSYLVKPVTFDTLVEMIKTLDLYWLVFSEKPGV